MGSFCRTIFGWIITFCALLLSSALFAYSAGDPEIRLSCDTYHLPIDETRVQDLPVYPATVMSHLGLDDQYQLAKGHKLYAFKVTSLCPQAQSFVLNTAITHANLLRIVSVNGQHIQTLLDVAADAEFDARPINSRVLVVPLETPGMSSQWLYIEYGSIANYPLFLSVYQDSYRQGLKSFFDMTNGVFFGAILVLILFFFLQFLVKPSWVLAYYCLLVLSVGLFVGQITGYWFQFLWPNHGLFNVRFSAVAGGFTYLWYFLFTSALFDLKKDHPKLHRFTVLVSALLAVAIFIGLFVDISTLIAIFALVALPLPVLIGVWAVRQQKPSAWIFLVGSALHCTFTYLFAMSVMGWDMGLQKSVFGLVGLGQLTDICLFAGALIYQTKVVRDELNQALIQKVRDAEALATMEREKLQSMTKLQDTVLQLAATTHDLTQPLASIKMALAVVDDQQSGAAKAKMQTAIGYTEKLLRSVIESAQADYFSADEFIAIRDVFESIQSRYEQLAKQKGLEFRTKEYGQTLFGSSIVVSRILDNLVSNALRYTEKGGVLVTARSRQGGLLLQVWDTGKGMPEEVIKDMNKPFKFNDKPAEKQGYGLGIFIVQSLCANAGFKLHVRAIPKRGSCCNVFIAHNERFCELNA